MNKIKSKFTKILSILFLMFALPVITIANNNIVEEYRTVTNQEMKNNSSTTLSSSVDHGEHFEEDGWQVLTSSTSISSGNYYLLSTLSRNITISSNIEVTICLNGQILRPSNSSNPIISMTNGTLTICDCKDGDTPLNNLAGDGNYYNSGIISYGEAENGAGVSVSGSNTTFNLDSGSIVGNTGSRGGGVYLTNRATFNMNGGAISGNSVDRYGGGLYINENCSAYLYDGEITYNQSDLCSGVYVASTFTMSGGTIAYNTLTNGISLSSGILVTVSSDFYMSGGYLDQSINNAGNVYTYGGYLGETAKTQIKSVSTWLRDTTETDSYMILGITEEYDGYEEDFPYAIVSASSHTTHNYTYSYEQISGDSTYHRSYCYCLDEYIDTNTHVFTDSYSPNGEDNHYVLCDYCEYQGTTSECSFTNSSVQLDGSTHTSYCVCGNTKAEDCTYTYRYGQFIGSSNSIYHAEYCECGSYIINEHDNFSDWTSTTVEGYDQERTCECGYTEYRTNSSSSSDNTDSTDTTDPDSSDSDDSSAGVTVVVVFFVIILVVGLIVGIYFIRKAKKDSKKDNKTKAKKITKNITKNATKNVTKKTTSNATKKTIGNTTKKSTSNTTKATAKKK